ncbi:MAG: hypothetical protein WD673_13585 [Alphaproteobacteria bacterium]
MTGIDTTRRDLIEEFGKTPIGRHSPDLRVLLNTLRMGQAPKGWNYVLVCVEPHRRWRLARKWHPRGSAVQLIDNIEFTSPEQAEREVFRLLWKEHTGEDLP